MGAPKKSIHVVKKLLCLYEDDVIKLEILARNLDESQSEIVRKAIKEYFDRRKAP